MPDEKTNVDESPSTSASCAHRYVQLMREFIFLKMSNCKRQSRAESFLQIKSRRKEQHSKLAVNKLNRAKLLDFLVLYW